MTRHVSSLVLLVVLLSGCEGQQFGAREKGALGGAALGAGLGAIVGNQVGNPGVGVAIGSGFGALAGGLLGEGMDQQDRDLAEREDRLDAQEREIQENRRLLEELRSRGVDVRQTARGVVVNLPDVLFEFDSARLTSSARATARDIARALRDVPGRRISVEGHTDSVGTVSYNQRLSESRARSVADALVDAGVSSQSIKTRGYGERDPVASNSSEVGRQRNRRVEVVIQNR